MYFWPQIEIKMNVLSMLTSKILIKFAGPLAQSVSDNGPLNPSTHQLIDSTLQPINPSTHRLIDQPSTLIPLPPSLYSHPATLIGECIYIYTYIHYNIYTFFENL